MNWELLSSKKEKQQPNWPFISYIVRDKIFYLKMEQYLDGVNEYNRIYGRIYKPKIIFIYYQLLFDYRTLKCVDTKTKFIFVPSLRWRYIYNFKFIIFINFIYLLRTILYYYCIQQLHVCPLEEKSFYFRYRIFNRAKQLTTQSSYNCIYLLVHHFSSSSTSYSGTLTPNHFHIWFPILHCNTLSLPSISRAIRLFCGAETLW